MRIPETATKGVALLSEMIVMWVFLFSDIRGNNILKTGLDAGTRSEEHPRHQEFLLTGMFPNHMH